MITAAGIYLYLSPNLPNVDDLYEVKLQIPLRVYTSDGELIGEFGEKRRTPVKYGEIPPQFVNAILAAEDSNFLEHKGVAIRGLVRAVAELLITGEKQTGGSTITMQVARNFFLSRERTFTRKFNEILLALEIERKLSKQQIFELYANKIFWGNRAYGVQAAAQVYYGKPIAELSLAQHAMIAGLPKAPSSFNPIVNPERAITRRNWILGRMQELGLINQSQYNEAIEQPVTASLHGARIDIDAPYAAEMARSKLLEMYGDEVYNLGFKVYTSIQSERQLAANIAIKEGILDYDQRHGYRGPEAHSYDPEQPEINLQNWLALLNDSRPVNGLIPAIVTAVDDHGIEVLFADESTGQVAFENGIQQARRFVSVNSLGPEIESSEDVCQVGDLIRVVAKPTSEQSANEQAKEPGEPGLETDLTASTTEWHFTQLPDVQASLISIDPNNGAIRAVVGGFDFNSSKYNRAVQGERQPGSNFKPFIYAAALNEGFTAASLFNDAPVVMADSELENTWRPENASGKFYGPTRLRKALYLSRNLVSVRLLRTITPAAAIDYVQSFGFDASRLPKDLSLSLGSHAVTPLEIVRGYSTFANGGFLIDPYIIERIVAENGDTIYQANPLLANCQDCSDESLNEAQEDGSLEPSTATSPASAATSGAAETDISPPATLDNPPTVAIVPQAAPQVIDERIAFIVDDILRDVIRRGTGVKAQALKRTDIAGKTGTTNGPIDAWFSGYNPTLATTVWLGFDQNQNLGRREYGGFAALPIWIDYMQAALANEPEIGRTQPNGITSVRIDPTSGKLASPLQDDGIFEYFRVENVPVDRAPAASTGYVESFDDSELPGAPVQPAAESLDELF